MVQQITNRKLFHVTVTKPYKQSLITGQTVRVGDTYNPFFQFYEGAREYPITHNGSIVNVKAVAWLRQVRDRIINTSPEILARIATEVVKLDPIRNSRLYLSAMQR